MINLKGYEIQQDLYRSQRTRVSRGCRLDDKSQVILKYPAEDYPPLRAVAGAPAQHHS